jgi:hypothetical protein
MANIVTNPTADQTIQSDNLLPASGNTTQSLGTAAASWILNSYLIANLAPGNFSGTQYNAVNCEINGGNAATMIHDPTYYAMNAYTAAMIVPANTTTLGVYGYGAWIQNLCNSQADNAAFVAGFYCDVLANATGASVWGANFVVTDNVIGGGVPTWTGTKLTGIEIDIGSSGSPDFVQGIVVASDFQSGSTVPSGAVYFDAHASNANSTLELAFFADRGAATYGLLVDGAAISGDCESQIIGLRSYNGATTYTATIQADGNGQLLLTAGNDSVVVESGLNLQSNINTYNNKATVGNGVPAEFFQVISATLTTNYNGGAAKTVFTPTAITMLRISAASQVVNTPTNGTLPSLTVSFTDKAGVARSVPLWGTQTGINSDAYLTATAQSIVIATNASTAVQITSAGYVAGTGTALEYYLAVTVEQL